VSHFTLAYLFLTDFTFLLLLHLVNMQTHNIQPIDNGSCVTDSKDLDKRRESQTEKTE